MRRWPIASWPSTRRKPTTCATGASKSFAWPEVSRSVTRRPKEAQYAAEFESAELLTLGIVYEKSSRFAGGAYSSFLKKVDRFSERTLAASLREREGFASRLVEIEAQTKRIIQTLQK